MKHIEIQENILSVDDFNFIYNSTGWKGFSISQIELSLKKDICHVSAQVDDHVVGMGRLVGDGVMYWYIQNLIVLPQYHSMGVGTTIMNYLLTYIRNHSPKNSHIVVGAMCSESTSSFYTKFNFNVRPYGKFGPGVTLEFDQ